MAIHTYIQASLACLDILPGRLVNVAIHYLAMLMSEASKHTLSYASQTSGLSVSSFSRFLMGHEDLAKLGLSRQARRTLKAIAAKERRRLVPGELWTIGIIVDATLHPRSSRHIQNSQSLSHGKGFTIGHQWTNIVIVVNGRTVPLPPIPFFTKGERRRRKLKNKTEHDMVIERLTSLDLEELVGPYSSSEVVTLLDSGYDDKKIIKAIQSRGWTAVWSLKSNRSTLTNSEYQAGIHRGRRVDQLFRAVRKQAPWINIRPKANTKNRKRKYRARELTGRVAGIATDLKLVCSEKSGRTKGKRYLACTKSTATARTVVLCYEIRWRVETFHRTIKSRLGMTEAGLSSFDAISAHVHWVYCAYLLLEEMEVGSASSIEEKQRILSRQIAAAPLVETIAAIVATRTQYGGAQRAKKLAAAALESRDAA